MTRDEAMRDVVEAARESVPRAPYSRVWAALDRLDAIPEEPEANPHFCSFCGTLPDRSTHRTNCPLKRAEAPAPEQKTVRVMTVEPECFVCGGKGKRYYSLILDGGVNRVDCSEPCGCVRVIDIPAGEVIHD